MKNLWKYIIISVALVLCAIVLATAYTHQSRTATGTISVTGLGETEFSSDVIVVKGTILCQNPDIAQGYLDIEAAKQRLVDFLAEYGIKAEEISFSMLNYYKQNESVYRDGDYIGERFKHYSLSQRFSIESRDVDGLESAAQNITSLIGEGYMLDVDDEQLPVVREDFDITSEDMPGWLVSTEGRLTVALDVTITDELRREGVARELINRIQNIRKDSGFEVTDKIVVEIEDSPMVHEGVEAFADYIAQQTLAVSLKLAAEPDGKFVNKVEFDESDLTIAVSKAE